MGFPYIAMPLRKRRGIRNSDRDTDDGKMWVRGLGTRLRWFRRGVMVGDACAWENRGTMGSDSRGDRKSLEANRR